MKALRTLASETLRKMAGPTKGENPPANAEPAPVKPKPKPPAPTPADPSPPGKVVPREKLPAALKPVYDRKPDWVSREIWMAEAIALYEEISRAKASSAIELGVASGFSSAVTVASLLDNSKDAKLYAFDLAEQCYYDKTRKTGQAVGEIFPDFKSYSLTTGVTSANIDADLDPVDFIFIDASHQHPWATLDLISLSRYARNGTVVGLHDINWPLRNPKAYNQNGARDLIRPWPGQKRIYESALNIGFIDYESDEVAFEGIRRSLSIDWDVEVPKDVLKQYLPFVDRFGPDAKSRIAALFDEKSKRIWRLR
jgi:predicted O-methyltransferase YrrM